MGDFPYVKIKPRNALCLHIRAGICMVTGRLKVSFAPHPMAGILSFEKT